MVPGSLRACVVCGSTETRFSTSSILGLLPVGSPHGPSISPHTWELLCCCQGLGGCGCSSAAGVKGLLSLGHGVNLIVVRAAARGAALARLGKKVHPPQMAPERKQGFFCLKSPMDQLDVGRLIKVGTRMVRGCGEMALPCSRAAQVTDGLEQAGGMAGWLQERCFQRNH